MFFRGYGVSNGPSPITLCLYKNTPPTSDKKDDNRKEDDTKNEAVNEAFVTIEKEEDVARAVERLNRNRLGLYTLELSVATEEEREEAVKAYEEYCAKRDSALVLRLRGLPYSSGRQDVFNFLPTVKGIVKLDLCVDMDQNPTGDAFLELENEEAYKEALTYHEKNMGPRYIEVLRCSAHERECIMAAAARRSRTQAFRGRRGGQQAPPYNAYSHYRQQPYDYNQYRAQSYGYGRGGNQGVWPYPTTDYGYPAPYNAYPYYDMNYYGMDGMGYGGYDPSLATQQRGPSPYIIRMRGLPLDFDENKVAKFFSEDVRIAPQGVHLVYSETNQPTGEAYVELETPDSVDKALLRNRARIKDSYVEVFVSSLQEMQMGDEVPMTGQYQDYFQY
ncbi:heterogeneous nuclear ribonucleoprotein F/H [Angomonas deanei]|uniref:RNA recognition motif. (A.k.a. RRM, RBD, or RNP domain), putative n=1 Tax=Angomonas deanei TaxID=59799 RepID=A0A7G2CR33_9TRYP|nr:heterogeneous nuclear ribonucleoprotein F/H [Angomonas deanei]CAD2221444.1 RNA recognition motif. (a.k.a. RRM, RBD, or RNP domain), putative [Angomonas deanei]|eukprot:EPY26762.1 heterogeneous nuclear ribonucleoprotein F/H [Angomonas deanei]